MKPVSVIFASFLICQPVFAADPLAGPSAMPDADAPQPVIFPIFSDRVAVIDGRTLWYPRYEQRVRLAGIDACDLPQWAMKPEWERGTSKAPSPVPCGAFAKAWLNRIIGVSVVRCSVTGYDKDGAARARCFTGGQDLALEMLRVGWARVVMSEAGNSDYMRYQSIAMDARYGMWATYVLDMKEWRRRAVDKTPERRPLADFNLLATRQHEISPPFAAARNRPRRTDR
ncbi:thermonuclease family protein [Ochrobactrum sp. SFR4]|nr:thermonuclease family protein [Ochrobactrum sp. SFR4]MBX8827189.1 thermonuclease family protein [Ochrobactrum sp. SFR4]